ncbi:MAG: ATP-binding protein [Bacillota bacterium]
MSLTVLLLMLIVIFTVDLFTPHDLPFLILYIIPLFSASWKSDGKYLSLISLLTTFCLISGSFSPVLNFGSGAQLLHRLMEIAILWFTYIILKQRITIEKELKGTNRLLKTIVDNTNMSLAYLDKDFNFIEVNRAYAEADQKDPSYFAGKNHFDLYPNKENEMIFRRVVYTGEAYFAGEKPLIYMDHPERGVTYWDWSLVPVKNPLGETEGLLISLFNVTSQVKARQEINHFHKLLEALYSSVNEAIFFVNPETLKIENCNRAAEKIFGYTKEEMIGTLASLRHIDSKHHHYFHQGVMSAYKKAEHFETEYKMKRKDGTIFPTENFVTPIYNDTGNLAVHVSIVRDITERKSTEEQLKAQKRRAEILSDISQEFASAGLDYPKVLKIASEKILELIGSGCIIKLLSEDADVLVPVVRVHKDAKPNEFLMTSCPDQLQSIDEGLLGRVARTGQSLLIRNIQDEDIRNVKACYGPFIEKFNIKSMLIVPLKFHSNVIGIIGVLRGSTEAEYTVDDQQLMENLADRISLAIANARLYADKLKEIEERKLAETNLKKTLRELEQFTYVSSHDLQEPLRMVSAYTSMLNRRYSDLFDETARQYMDFVVDGAKRMQHLIKDLLNYSRISSKERIFKRTDCLLILEKVIDDLSLQIQESRAKVSYENMPAVNADPLLITQLFQNLISNALKFSKDKAPEIHISCTERDDDYLFSVKDNGIGIDKKYFDKIFIIFQRLHTRDEYPGTGIGLTICSKIVDQHGGRIWVESENGKGSTFYFTLPKINQPLVV